VPQWLEKESQIIFVDKTVRDNTLRIYEEMKGDGEMLSVKDKAKGGERESERVYCNTDHFYIFLRIEHLPLQN
jgi:hypothetical protein